MRWKDSATGPAAAVQMLTMPVATCSVVGLLQDGSTHVQFGGRRTAGPDGSVTERLDVLQLAQGVTAATATVYPNGRARVTRTCPKNRSLSRHGSLQPTARSAAIPLFAAGSSPGSGQRRRRHQRQHDDEPRVARLRLAPQISPCASRRRCARPGPARGRCPRRTAWW